MRRSITGSFLVWAVASTAFGQEVVREFSSPELEKIENTTDQPKTVTLLDVKDPGVTTFRYAVDGDVRYENVQGKSYLEMWSWFPDDEMFFSRTLGTGGPMEYLEGSSGWRPFSLPFFSDAKNGSPTRIVVNVVFVGQGTVHLRNVKLQQYQSGWQNGKLHQDRPGWWTARTGALIGLIGGTIFGLLGGLIGALGGMGKARCFVLTLTATLVGLGIVSLVIGVIAVVFGQPHAVCFPLLLLGIILTAVCGGNLPSLRRRYEQIELRKMAAMDSR